MEVRHNDNGVRGKFYIAVNGEEEAELTYTWAGPDSFIIDHTEVRPLLRGQGIGRRLVMAAVDSARKRGVYICTLCAYARGVFEKSPDIGDVLMQPL